MKQIQPQHFGAFLIDQHMATTDQILEALNHQRLQQQPLGQLAYQHGKMSSDQIFSTLSHQIESRLKFGEIATGLGLGYLTEHDLQELLMHQKQTRPSLGDILVAMDVIDGDSLERILAMYMAQQEIPES